MIWWTLLRRQWATLSAEDFGVRFAGGAAEIARALAVIEGGGCVAKPPAEFIRDAKELSDVGQQFLFGVGNGYVPAADGLLTYHCKGATPIHYRYTPGPGGPPLM